MNEQTFTIWLLQRYDAARRALIGALENRDHMYYVEAPALRQEYMKKIGGEEKAVLERELEVYLLERKKDLIQREINRGQEPDLDAIDRLIKEEINEKIGGMEKADKTLQELPELTEEEHNRLQKIYHDIVETFHPQVNPQINDVQKDLYEHALEAYKTQNLKELEVVHGMLFDEYQFGRELERAIETYKALKAAGLLEASEKEEDAEKPDPEELRQKLGTALFSDFTLAAELFDAFRKDENDLEIQKYTEETMEQVRAIRQECEELKTRFPFSAKETLASRAKTKAYLDNLVVRSGVCETKKTELEKKIASLVTGEQNGQG